LPPLKLRPVRRIRDPMLETVERCAREGDPLVITGMLEWPAIGAWTPEVLRQRAGTVRTSTHIAREGKVRPDLEPEQRSLAECADLLQRGGSPRFASRTPVQAFPQELRDQLGVPPYCRDARGMRADAWISAPETWILLHFELLHTLVAQVHGQTRFLIFPAKERSNLYPFPVSSAPHVSRVDLAEPDLVAFPRLSAARGFHCDLQQGELLLIPGRAWQSAEALVTSITVRFRWPPLAMLPVVTVWDALKRFRGQGG
jgi:hypothetical protein